MRRMRSSVQKLGLCGSICGRCETCLRLLSPIDVIDDVRRWFSGGTYDFEKSCEELLLWIAGRARSGLVGSVSEEVLL